MCGLFVMLIIMNLSREEKQELSLLKLKTFLCQKYQSKKKVCMNVHMYCLGTDI